MSLVKFLGFQTLGCGCISGRYKHVGTGQEVVYIEQKGEACTIENHRRNQVLKNDAPK